MKTYDSSELASFIIEHYPVAAEWRKLEDWINWEIENGFCFLVGDDHGLCGLTFVRPVMDVIRARDDQLYFDQEGDTLFVDLAVAKERSRSTLQAFAMIVRHRFGIRDKFARRNGGNDLVVRSMKTHLNRLLKTKVSQWQ